MFTALKHLSFPFLCLLFSVRRTQYAELLNQIRFIRRRFPLSCSTWVFITLYLYSGAKKHLSHGTFSLFSSQVFTKYGKCYMFNSGEEGRPLLTTVKGGTGNGLEIMLDIQQDEYLPIWGETGKKGLFLPAPMSVVFSWFYFLGRSSHPILLNQRPSCLERYFWTATSEADLFVVSSLAFRDICCLWCGLLLHGWSEGLCALAGLLLSTFQSPFEIWLHSFKT